MIGAVLSNKAFDKWYAQMSFYLTAENIFPRKSQEIIMEIALATFINV